MLTKIVSLLDFNGAIPAKEAIYLLWSYPPFELALWDVPVLPATLKFFNFARLPVPSDMTNFKESNISSAVSLLMTFCSKEESKLR